MKTKQLPVLWFLVACTLPLLGILAINQFRWLQELQTRERNDKQEKIASSVQNLSRYLRDELLFFPTLLRVRNRSGQDGKAAFAERYQIWQNYALSPQLMSNIYLYDTRSKLAQEWIDGSFITVGCPPCIQTLVSDLTFDDVPETFFRHRNKSILLVFPLPHTTRRTTFVFCVLDSEVILTQIIPRLAEDSIDSNHDFDFRIHDYGNTRTLYTSPGNRTEEEYSRPDVDISLRSSIGSAYTLRPNPLLQQRIASKRITETELAFSTERIIPDRPDIDSVLKSFESIRIQILYRDGSLEQITRRTTRQNAAISFGLVILLAVVIITLAEATRKSRALAASQKTFIASVTHELKTPLAVISSASQNLADGIVADKEKARQYGSMIRKEALRLTAAIDHFLLFANSARITRMTMEACTVADLINSALKYTEEERETNSITTKVELPNPSLVVVGNRIALESAIQNLVQNAVRHGKSGKYLGISARLVTRGKKRAEVVLTIRDKGPGIPQKDRNRIFEPFMRGDNAIASQTPGNGVGLNLTKKIIMLHNGTIELETRAGEGSVFTVRLHAYTGEGNDNQNSHDRG